jgi:hypothetical protein
MEQHNQNPPAYTPAVGVDSEITATDTTAVPQHIQNDEYQYVHCLQ